MKNSMTDNAKNTMTLAQALNHKIKAMEKTPIAADFTFYNECGNNSHAVKGLNIKGNTQLEIWFDKSRYKVCVHEDITNVIGRSLFVGMVSESTGTYKYFPKWKNKHCISVSRRKDEADAQLKMFNLVYSVVECYNAIMTVNAQTKTIAKKDSVKKTA